MNQVANKYKDYQQWQSYGYGWRQDPIRKGRRTGTCAY